MPRYFVRISYDGTNYNGWQVQENTPHTIQQILNASISKLLNEPVEFLGCGRTDTGVHAKEFYAHFDTTTKFQLFSSALEKGSDDWVYKFNSVLPRDIAVHEILKVNEKTSARFDAVSRTYKYYIIQERDPFLKDRAYFVRVDLDLDKMNEACKILMRYTDFSCFSKLHTQVKTNDCKITFAQWEKVGKQIIFTITADRFLRNMVRAIVGTMIDIGKHKIDLEDFKKIIEGKNRSEAGVSVPAHGLFLEEVKYKSGIFVNEKLVAKKK